MIHRFLRSSLLVVVAGSVLSGAATTVLADTLPEDAALPVKQAVQPAPAPSPTAAPVAAPVAPVAAVVPPLPEGRAILRQFVDACGGAASFAKADNVALEGTLSMAAQGVSGTLAIYQKRPNMVLAITELSGIRMAEGFDGTTGWASDPIQGPRILDGPELEQIKNAGGGLEVFGYADADTYFTVARTLERTTFQEKDAFKVALETQGGEKMTGYFDPATSLQLGMEATLNSPMGAVPVTVAFSDWKTFSGVKIPTTMTQIVMGMTVLTTIESMKFNVPDLPSFSPPAEVTEAEE